MSRLGSAAAGPAGAANQDEDRQRLLSSTSRDSYSGDEDDAADAGADPADPTAPAPPLPPRTPRSANRVRFNLEPTVVEPSSTRRPTETFGLDDGYGGGHGHGDDGDDGDGDDDDWGGSRRRRQRHPLLLTDREAPSVALANSAWVAARSSVDEAYYDEEAILDRDRDHQDPLARAELERLRPRSGMRSAFVNMANSIIGAGIIGQPYAMRQAGLATGIALLVGLTLIVDWTIRLIVINSKLSGSGSFQGTVERCFGRTGLVAVSLAQWLFAFGGMVAFCVIVGDSLPTVLTAVWPGLGGVPVLGWMADRRGAMVGSVLAVSFPLTLYRDIANLAKASALALISMIIILAVVLMQGVVAPAEDRGRIDGQLLLINGGVFQAIGVISFAFVCHHNSLLIYGSLKTPTINRFALVTHLSTGISMLACLAMGLAGFLIFGDRTLGNVLNNLPRDSAAANLARLCFGLNMLTTLPLEAFVCREVMLNCWAPRRAGRGSDLWVHVGISTGLVLGALAFGLATCDLGSVFELVGATSACALAYVLPPLCYIRLTTRSWRTYAAGAVAAFGCAVAAISVAQAVQKMVGGDRDATYCS